MEYGADPITSCITSEKAITEVEDLGSRKQLSFSIEKMRAEHRDGGLYIK